MNDLNKLNNEYIKFKQSNNKKRGKKKKFSEFIRFITTVSVEVSENDMLEDNQVKNSNAKKSSAKKLQIQKMNQSSMHISKEKENNTNNLVQKSQFQLNFSSFKEEVFFAYKLMKRIRRMWSFPLHRQSIIMSRSEIRNRQHGNFI